MEEALVTKKVSGTHSVLFVRSQSTTIVHPSLFTLSISCLQGFVLSHCEYQQGLKNESMSSDDLEGDDIWGDSGGSSEPAPAAGSEESKQQQPEDDPLEDEETRHMTISELRQRIHLLNNDIRVMKSDVQRITHESRGQRDRIKENQEKVKVNKQLPYLVANVVEVLEPDAEDGTWLRNLDSLYEIMNILLCSTTLTPAVISPFLWFCGRLVFSSKLLQQDWRKKKEAMQPTQFPRHVRRWCARVHAKPYFSRSLVWSIQKSCDRQIWWVLTRIPTSF